jgi:parvulin-like peptidyl-prolyl isomerase
LFGSDGVRAIINDKQWHGPIHAARGAHFIRIDERRPAETLSFEQVAGYIAEEWEIARQHQKLAKEVAELGKRYTIILPPSPPGR